MTGRRMSSPCASAVVVLLVLVVALTGCSGGSSSTAAPSTSTAAKSPSSNALQWHDCGGGECATLPVPLDNARPESRKIGLALFRVPAQDPERRIGSLLLNPGGPGAGGVEFARWFSLELPDVVRERFDIVGWDPRGTGGSEPVRCGQNLDYLFAVDTGPDDATEQEALEAAGKRFADACAARSGDLLAHISSVDTVQDIDRIRAALGDKRLNYMGFSYGTYLGTLYEQLFQSTVRAMVLDGAVDPTLSVDEASIQQAQGFERSLDAFFDWCTEQRSCPIGGDDEPRRVFDAVRDRAETRPLTRRIAGESRTLGPTQLDIAVAAQLYGGEAAYEDLAAALDDARRRDPRMLLASFDSYVGREPGGRYNHEWGAFLGISCLDGPTLSLPELRALEAKAAEAAPRFGAATVGLGVACSVWPVPPIGPTPVAPRTTASTPVVVVGTTGDPATPLSWAEALASQLGDARLITVEGEQHTAYPGGPCLRDAVDAYLVRLKAPANGLRCPAQ